MANESQNSTGIIVAVVALIAIVFITFIALRIMQAQPVANNQEPIIQLDLNGDGGNGDGQGGTQY